MTDLADLLARPEGRTLDFKRDLSSRRPLMKTLVAFANTAGGTVVVGRDDEGTVRGVPDPQQAEEQIANAVADSITPALLPDIEIAEAAGHTLLVVRVAHFPGPFYITSEGPERGVYVRLGSTSRQATAAQREELERIAQAFAFDQRPCPGTTLDDLDLEAARHSFEAVGRSIDEGKLESLGVLVRQGRQRRLSNGGMILFGKEAARRRFFPHALVRCARFAGTDKVDFLDQFDIENGLLAALDEAPRFIRRNTRLAARIESMRRQDVPEYPTVALREALVNAIAHTDYSQRGLSIRLAIFDDHLEIESPGSWPPGVSLDDLLAGVSHIRNPVIARVLRELSLMERWGTGYKRIREACEAGGYPLPTWHDIGPVLRTRFAPHPEVARQASPTTDVGVNVGTSVGINVPINDRQSWFLKRIEAGERITASDLANRFNVSRRTAERDIKYLREEGVIEFVGPLRTGRYQLVEAEP